MRWGETGVVHRARDERSDSTKGMDGWAFLYVRGLFLGCPPPPFSQKWTYTALLQYLEYLQEFYWFVGAFPHFLGLMAAWRHFC